MDNRKEEKNNMDEIEAIKSAKRKMSPGISVPFRHFTLDDAINYICTAPFDKKKALLLYLYNSKHPFSKTFSRSLESGKIVEILNKSFLILSWDVEDPKYHDALVSALSQHVNLSIVAELVTNKVSVGICILPINGTISITSCLRGNISVNQITKGLEDVEQTFYEELEKEKELKRLEEESNNENDLTSKKLHRIWADMLGDRDYDRFEYDQHVPLKTKIGFALKGPPEQESGYDEKTLAQVEELYNVITFQSNEIAEYKDLIEIAFIYNCLEPLPDKKVRRSKQYPDYKPQTDVNPVPIFILRKCRGSDNPCRIFIDDSGRVYQSWMKYLTNNKYPAYEMIVPLDGRYQVENDEVLLETHTSPACNITAKFLQVADITSSVLGVTTGVVFAASVAFPIGVPLVVATVATTGLLAGTYALTRSIFSLYDRYVHAENLSIYNSEARGAYLNIAAGTLGFAGAGASMALAQLAKNGENIGRGMTFFVNMVAVANITTNGASLVNSGYEVFDQWYNENQTPTTLTILQLSTSVLFFGHAVYNFRGAQTIIDETQTRVLQDYQDSLRSNRHRKIFNKLMKETIRTQGDTSRGRAEVISAIRNIQNKDEVFATLTRNNRAMNRAGIRFSAEGGQIKLNGMAVDMNEFIGLKKSKTETFLNNLFQQRSNQQQSNQQRANQQGSSYQGSSQQRSSQQQSNQQRSNQQHSSQQGSAQQSSSQQRSNRQGSGRQQSSQPSSNHQGSSYQDSTQQRSNQQGSSRQQSNEQSSNQPHASQQGSYPQGRSQQSSSQQNSNQQYSDGQSSSQQNTNQLKTVINDILVDLHIDTSGANLNQLVGLTLTLFHFCSEDIRVKVVSAVYQTRRYLLNAITQLAQEIDQIIPRERQFPELLHLGLSFFSKKVDELEWQYQMYRQPNSQKMYFQPLFEYVNNISLVERTVQFFEFVVNNSYSGEMLTRAVIEEFSLFIQTWITRIIWENEENTERERKRTEHSSEFRVKRVNCSICGGYYFNRE